MNIVKYNSYKLKKRIMQKNANEGKVKEEEYHEIPMKLAKKPKRWESTY